MRALRVLSAAFALLLAGASAPTSTLYGFTTVASDHERVLESQFLDIPSAVGALDAATAIASQPHPAGTPADYLTATSMRDQLQSFGFTAALEPFTAQVDTVKTVALTLYPTGAAPLGSGRDDSVHSLFGRSRHSPAAAPHGTAPAAPVVVDLHEPPIPSDPDTSNGAIGVPFLAGSADGTVTAPLTYVGGGSDADYALLAAHAVDPRGAVALVRGAREFRGTIARRAQAHGVAGVMFFDDPADDGPVRAAAYPSGPGRPLTSVRRGTVGAGITIPALPVSAATAQTLLAALHGPSAPAPWSGALAVGYPFARGPAMVRLSVVLTRKQMTLWNTVGTLPGLRADEHVLLAAHRDAWVFGATENASGAAALIEVARALGFLARGGWRPIRSIVVAGWDGEDLAADGALAYVKKHGDDDARAGGVAYIDAEQSVTGPRFGADAVAAIASTVSDATHAVGDPLQPGATLYDRWSARSRAMPARSLAGDAFDHLALPLGVGIPSANAGFAGATVPYHSAYDTLTYAKTFSDPNFALHRAEAQLIGVIAMRIADADVVPYHFSAYVPLMQGGLRALSMAARTTKTRVDTTGLARSIGRFAGAAQRFDRATSTVATIDAAARALESVRVIDVAVYSSEGVASPAFPDVARAVATGSQSDVDRATARARTAIDRAADLLAI